MRRSVLILAAGISMMLALPDGPATGERLRGAMLLTDRQSSDVRVVMYMTPW
jgi:hypothetical protein